MRVVDVRDFCIPSDENDYDELVAFADAMAGVQQFDAVPIDVLDKIRAEIEETYMNITYQENKDRKATWGLRKALEIIDKYKAESEE